MKRRVTTTARGVVSTMDAPCAERGFHALPIRLVHPQSKVANLALSHRARFAMLRVLGRHGRRLRVVVLLAARPGRGADENVVVARDLLFQAADLLRQVCE